jgi:DNA-binding MarR family transcriptional regulator
VSTRFLGTLVDVTRWLTDDEQRAWRALQQMTAALDRRLADDLAAHSGLSDSDYGVLVCLSEAPEGQLRARDIAAELSWEKSRLSHHLTRMAGRGLVERRDCPTDARGAVVVLTPAGREAIEAAAPRHVEDVRRWVVDVLTPEQLAALGEACEAVLAKLRS